MRYNELEPVLPWDIGWVLGHKVGTADEKKQYRILFREDDDFHGTRPFARRDNWLVGKEVFLEAQQLVDTRNVPVKGTSEVIFHSGPAKWQTNYAAALEEDGQLVRLKDRVESRPQFGEVARQAFETALREWDQFGSQREIVTGSGFRVRLGELERYESEAADAQKRLEELEPGLKQKIVDERKAKISQEDLAVLDVPGVDRTPEQHAKAAEVEAKLSVSSTDLAENMPAEKRAEAEKLAKDVDELHRKVRSTKTSRDIVQFIYWRTRCEAECTPDAIKAREVMYDAKQAYLNDIDLDKAKTLYEESFTYWRTVLDKFPLLLNGRVVTDDLVGPVYLPGGIRYYEQVLKKLDLKFPEDFILKDVVSRSHHEPPIGK
jgi:hypothetical protein